MAKAKEKEKKAKAKAEEPKRVEAEVVDPREPSDELKVVITMKGDRSIVGIQSPECDPVFTPLEGGLDAVLARVPALVKSANEKWDANPKNPKTVRPEPPPEPEPAPRPAAAKPKKKEQPSFF